MKNDILTMIEEMGSITLGKFEGKWTVNLLDHHWDLEEEMETDRDLLTAITRSHYWVRQNKMNRIKENMK